VRELESFARSQPVAFFVCAAAADFLATRFLKAGSRDTESQTEGAFKSQTQTDFTSMTGV